MLNRCSMYGTGAGFPEEAAAQRGAMAVCGPPFVCVSLYDRPAQLHLHLQEPGPGARTARNGVCFDAGMMKECAGDGRIRTAAVASSSTYVRLGVGP